MKSKESAIRVIDDFQEILCGISDDLWDHPELCFQEYFAAERYCTFLKEQGFEVEEAVDDIPTAFVAGFGSGRPVIGLLAEYDALGGMSQEAEALERKPVTPGAPGHGCGHNLLGVGCLAAALALKSYLESGQTGTVRLYGCPAEEGGSAKSFMARDGLFDDVDVALTWHPSDFNEVGNGGTLANQQVNYKFHGKAAHAAICPEMGRSALDALELMNVGVQFLREHVPTDCRIHYAITNAGGDAPGVVQSSADVFYLMRAPFLDTVADLRRRIDNIAKGAALMTDTTVEAVFVKATSNTIPNRVLGKLLHKNMEALGGPEFDDADRELARKVRATIERPGRYYSELASDVRDEEIRERLLAAADEPLYEQIIPFADVERCSQASSDVGDVSCVCPVGQFCVTTMPAGTGMHSWQEVAVGKSAMAHKGMLKAGKILAAAAIDIYEDPEITEKARAELVKRTGGKPWNCLIPEGMKPLGISDAVGRKS